MNTQDLFKFIVPVCLIIAGIMAKFSKNKETFGIFKQYWFVLVILGLILFFLRLFKYLNQ